MIKTYTITHSLELTDLFDQYKVLLNRHIENIWNAITWETKAIRKKQNKNYFHLPYKQVRILPTLPDKRPFDKPLRQQYVRDWNYSTHWINGAMDTAWAIIKSWYANYKNGTRKRHMPVAKRSFMRVKQTLMKWDHRNRLRISIKPNQFVYIDFSKRYFKLGKTLGEPIITPDKIYLPFHFTDPVDHGTKIAWDANFHSLDGFSPSLGWIKVDIKPIHSLHATYREKRRSINKVYARNKHKGKILYRKYRTRERNRVNDYVHRLAKNIAQLADTHGFESLETWRMVKKSKNHNRKLSDTDWRKIVHCVELYKKIQYIEPYYTSKTCSRCGKVHKDLKGEHQLICAQCGFIHDRQCNAAINLYQRMNGVTHSIQWFDQQNIGLGGGMPAIGVEMSVSDELAREHDELMKPKQMIRLSLKCDG